MPLKIPMVAVALSLTENNPNGLPKAITHSPRINSSELPNFIYFKSCASILSKAISVG